MERVFDSINVAHVACGHGGIKRTYYEIRHHRNIANITIEQIKIFLSLCEICKRKKNILKKRDNNNKKIISSNFGERGQLDLIDLSMSCTEDGYKYILNYQDHLTKFVMLKPLKSKKSSEVNKVLLDIFTTLGAPEILQCDNGTEFSTIKTDVLTKYWPHCKLIHSRPRHPQSQGSVERANGDVMNMLRGWLSNNNSSSWVEGLKFIQMCKNNAYNRTINCSPYKATFGREMPVMFNENDSSNVDDEFDDESLANICEDENVLHECSNSSSNIDEPTLSENISSSSNSTTTNHSLSNDQFPSCSYNVKSIRKVSQQLSKYDKDSDDNSKEIMIGTPVLLKVPKIDCHKLAFPNMVGIIYKYLPDIKKYKIKTKHGIVDRIFSVNDFEVCQNLNVDIDLNSNDDEKSLRQLAKLDSMKFVGCQCFGMCQNKKCFCFKNKRTCGKLCRHKSTRACLNNNTFKRKDLRVREKKNV